MHQPDPLRVGIVGCGYQGGILAKAVGKTASFTFVACADPDRGAAEKLAAEAGSVLTFDSVERLLEGSDVDVVLIATPHHILAPAALAAIQGGKHVLVEKPIGLIEAEAAQIEKAAAKAKVIVEAGYSFRRLPAWQRVHELLAVNAIGDVIGISGFFSITPLSQGWLASPETGGGPLLFLGSHLVDQILWYFDVAPVEVFAHVSRRADTKADDTSAFQIRFANGAVAQCLVTQASAAFGYGLEVHGRAGRLRLSPAGFLDHEIVISSTVMPEYAQPTSIRPPMTDDPRMVKHTAQLEALARAIRTGGQPYVTIADGRKALRVIDAVFRSGETGQPVRLA